MENIQHAILIPGLLRCIDKNILDFLDSASGLARIFILTEKCCEKQARQIVLRYNASSMFIEDTEVYRRINTSNFEGPYQQFLKLDIALNQLAAWETKEKHQFKFIHRFRTDLAYETSFAEYTKPLLSITTPKSYLLNQHDMNFSGKREDMLKLKGISSYVRKFRKRKNFFEKQITKINSSALRDSDSNLSIFRGALPVGIARSESDFHAFHVKIQNQYSNYIDAALSYAQSLKETGKSSGEFDILFSDSILARTFTGKYSPFFPEFIYARYLNTQGLSTKTYATPWLQLRHSRHAVTEFTNIILNQIQSEDYSFFDEKLDWEKELEEFEAANGSIGKLLYIFTLIHPYKLTDIQCVKFYEIIDMLNQTEYIRTHHIEFIRKIKHRGLEPPKSIKQWIDI